ncbi:MAG: hypothetical protein HWE08_13515 [Alphaproteobacteria bacterium]|nr:hypothetical protein [Alphaproteobacteria bacterium]
MLGQRPCETMRQTLPELDLAVRGWQRANGIDPDRETPPRAMTYSRLQELAERSEANG